MSSKISTATIGYGFHGKELMTRVIAENELAQMVGVVDVNPARRAQAEQDGYHAYTTPKQLLSDHSDLQYIAMAVNHPNTLRAVNDLAEAATRYGLGNRLAVTVEKPIASYLREAKEAADILQQAFRYSGVFNRLEYPSFRYALGQIAAGAIGDIQAINDVIDIWLLPPGLDPWKHLPDPNNPSNTRGNALLNGFHCAGTLAILAGLPERVSATIKKQGWYPEMEVDDTVEAHVHYPTFGARYHCEWGASPMLRLATQVVGSDQTIIFEEWGDVHQWQPGQPTRTTHFDNPPDFAGKHRSGNFNYHDAILRHLVSADQNPLPHSVEHALAIGLVAQTIVEATYLSSGRQGKPVTIEETIDNILSMEQLQEIARRAVLPLSTRNSLK